MAMEIGAYNGYASGYYSAGVQKQSDAAEKTKYGSVQEYAAALAEKFPYFGKSASVYGVPTTVTVSQRFLQKCLQDPAKAEWFERNLAAIPEGTRLANEHLKTAPGNPVTVFRKITIDENGHMSSVSRATNDPDGRIARENAEKKARARREDREKLEKKLEKKRAEKKEQNKKLREKAQEESQIYESTVYGSDIWDIIRKTIQAASRVAGNISAPAVTSHAMDSGFDKKA